MNLKVPGAVLLLGHAFLSTGAKTDWGLQHPPSETRVKGSTSFL